MRDWVLEMRAHGDAVQNAIEVGKMDEAWRLAQVFQAWCVERINAERYSQQDAGTLLSVPQQLLVRVLDVEGKDRAALAHLMFQGVLDRRDLKFYSKDIKRRFRKCGFTQTSIDVALKLYESQKAKQQPWDTAFVQIRDAVASWH